MGQQDVGYLGAATGRGFLSLSSFNTQLGISPPLIEVSLYEDWKDTICHRIL